MHADHYPGKSHKEDAGGYPAWGDDASLSEGNTHILTVDNYNLENLRRKTWRESAAYARNKHGRLPTLSEVRQIIAFKANKKTWEQADYPKGTATGALVNMCQWIAVTDDKA